MTSHLLKLIVVASLLVFAVHCQISEIGISDQGSVNNACPFVYGARVPTAQDGLVNCTWYSSNACCIRTEVTSVFDNMLPLDTPLTMEPSRAKHCRNLINYMMCYFCDPYQANWYTQKQQLNICDGFCNDAFSYCKEASFDGEAIGEKFSSGEEFCEAQQFEVIPGESECFKFDPTVFDHSSYLSANLLIVVTSCLLGLILRPVFS